MITIVDLLESFLGEELTPRILPVSSRLSRCQFEDILDALTLFEEEAPWTSSPSLNGSVAGLVPQLIRFNELQRIGASRYIQSLQSRLLYYPQVHVLHALDPSWLRLRLASPSALDEFLRVYIDLRELIQSECLVVSLWPDPEETEPDIEVLNQADSEDHALVELTRNLRPYSYYPNIDDPLQIIDEYNITQVVASSVDTSWAAKYPELERIHAYKLKRLHAELGALGGIEMSATDLFDRLALRVSPHWMPTTS
jgi:hypothetical protein